VGEVRAVARSLVFALLGQAAGAAHVVDVLVQAGALAHVVHQAVAEVLLFRDRRAAAVITQGDGGLLLQGQVEMLGGVLHADGTGTDVGSGVIHHGHHAGAGLGIGGGLLGRTTADRGCEQQGHCPSGRSMEARLHERWVF